MLIDSVASRDHKNPEKVHDGLSSSGFLAPPTGEHTLPVLNVSTDSDVNGSASLGFPSPVASFLNRDRIVRYVYYPSPSHSGDTCMDSDDAMRYDSVMDGDNAGAVRLDCAEANIDPFAFKPLDLVALVDSKSLENLESFGGVEGLLHGLGTNRHRGLNTASATQRQARSPDPDLGMRGISAVTPFVGVELTPLPNTSPATASCLGASGEDRSATLKSSVPHEATIQDRQRIYGHNIPPHPSKPLLRFMWLALYDKVLVSPKISHTISLNLISIS